jgi:hypothetical protein
MAQRPYGLPHGDLCPRCRKTMEPCSSLARDGLREPAAGDRPLVTPAGDVTRPLPYRR